jgi:hypothetical protein
MGRSGILLKAGNMSSTTTTSTTSRTTPFRTTSPSETTRELALTAPMLLFAHGILRWIDDLGGHGGSGVLWFLAQAALVASALSFAGVAVGLRRLLGGGAMVTLAAAATLLGALLTTWVALASGIGGVAALQVAPTGVVAIGPALLVAGLLVVLAPFATAGLLSTRHFGLVAVGGLVAIAPVDLIPLAALLVLIGIEPLLARRVGDPG